MTGEVIKNILLYIADWSVPVLIVGIPLYGFIRGVKVYEVFVEGAKEGFEVAVRIMPYLVAILVAIGIFRDVQAMEKFGNLIAPLTGLIKMPAEILPMAIVRPLSGSGAMGVMNSIFIEYGPDSYLGLLASVMMGSTETTFYVLAVYFGSVNIRKSRHAVVAGLSGDFAGIMAAVILCYLVFGNIDPLKAFKWNHLISIRDEYSTSRVGKMPTLNEWEELPTFQESLLFSYSRVGNPRGTSSSERICFTLNLPALL